MIEIILVSMITSFKSGIMPPLYRIVPGFFLKNLLMNLAYIKGKTLNISIKSSIPSLSLSSSR
jgi:hypothetical protein